MTETIPTLTTPISLSTYHQLSLTGKIMNSFFLLHTQLGHTIPVIVLQIIIMNILS